MKYRSSFVSNSSTSSFICVGIPITEEDKSILIDAFEIDEYGDSFEQQMQNKHISVHNTDTEELETYMAENGQCNPPSEDVHKLMLGWFEDATNDGCPMNDFITKISTISKQIHQDAKKIDKFIPEFSKREIYIKTGTQMC